MAGLSFYIVEDDPDMLALEEALLIEAGHTVRSSTSSPEALKQITAAPPDCVIVDIMLPELDGLELCHQLRQHDNLSKTRIIMVTAKTYESDQRLSVTMGADGFISKPIDQTTFVEEITNIIADHIELRFWGVHGSLPVPGNKTRQYGGNTSCVSLLFQNNEFFIFDAGTGIRVLSDYLMDKQQSVSGRIFITHPHWDHLNALPFFAPLYVAGNKFEIIGPKQGKHTMEQLVNAQMDSIFFPVNADSLASGVKFRDIGEERFVINDIEIQSIWLRHPGNCLGYRVNYANRSISYITDNEIYYPEDSEYDQNFVDKLTTFVQNSNILIIDSTYTDEAYKSKKGWGHSSVSQVVSLAHDAVVNELYLFHHDTHDTDDVITKKVDDANKWLKKQRSYTHCKAPIEGMIIKL